MIQIVDKTTCCGCTACYSICPCNCIQMKPDFEGFLYPVVDESRCIECGLCDSICPVKEIPEINSFERKSYVVRTKDIKAVMKATSGGVFIPLADWVLSINGIICAAAFDEEFNVIHNFIAPHEKIVCAGNVPYERFVGSKYVQSDLGVCFRKIKAYLKADRHVCFVGTTCQVAGLKKFLKGHDEKLLTVDLVCHGTPSPKLWKKYIVYQTEKYGSQIKGISFRNKTFGYHSGGFMNIRFKNGKSYLASARVDYMLKCFFNEISSRPSCYQCSFKQLERCSDLTLYDCWHAAQLSSAIRDDDKGYTNVIVQTQKGANTLKRMEAMLYIYPVETEQAKNFDGVMIDHNVIPHPQRTEFYRRIDERKLPDLVQEFLPISTKDYIVEELKHILYRIGVLQILKNVRKM